jgi:hypothetical protein
MDIVRRRKQPVLLTPQSVLAYKVEIVSMRFGGTTTRHSLRCKASSM